MTDSRRPSPDDQAASARRRRRRLAEVFGDPLPETTRDDRSDGWGDGKGGSSNDDRLRRDVPPHHG